MSFYVTLPSDSSPDFFPENTVARFKTYLPEPLTLSGRWEVGLVEIVYPHSWENVTDNMYFVSIKIDKKVGTYEIPHGYYSKIEDLIHVLPHNFLKGQARIYYKPEIRRTVVQILSDKVMVKFSPALSILLGFSPSTSPLSMDSSSVPFRESSEYLPKISYMGDFAADVESVKTIFVYCDIIEAQYVGHVKVPLLRTVKTKAKPGETIEKTYENPHYLPVSKKEIRTIEVDLRTESGEPVPFQHGGSMVKLHFRPARSPFFT